MPPALFIQWKLHFGIKNSLHTLRATTSTHPQHYTIRPSSSLLFFRASTAPPLTFDVYAKSKSVVAPSSTFHHPFPATTTTMSFTVNDVPFPSSPCVSVNDHSPSPELYRVDRQEELDSKRATAIIAVVILLIILFYLNHLPLLFHS